jgi:hypothetical protein
MSKIKVNEIEAATGSTVTIPTGQTFTVTDGIPATNLSGTIADARLPTVPVAKGGTGLTSLGSAGQAVKVNSAGNALEFGAVAGGKVLQVKNVATNQSGVTTNTAWTDTGMSLAITPSATSSKVLVMVNGTIAAAQTTYSAGCAVMRGTTPIGGGDNGRYANGGCVDHWAATKNNYHKAHWSFNFLDTPNTTSATTYKVVFASGYTNSDGGAAYWLRNQADDDHFDDIGTMTLIEIGA